jgi:mannose-6-phosphate isomerase-like protein (cupin superfamily)
MHVTRFADARPYAAPGHVDVHSLRLQGMEASPAFATMGLSYYLPGSKAAMSAGEAPKLYLMIEGELVVEAGGRREALRALDSCLIEAGESREVRNETNRVATMLVVMPPPAA